MDLSRLDESPESSYIYIHIMPKRSQHVPTWLFGIITTHGILEQQCGVVDDASVRMMSVASSILLITH